MATFEEHREKCQMAELAQSRLESDTCNEHADWIVTTVFYQALHWIDAFFALSGYHPAAHGKTYDEYGEIAGT
jgi:hypothetical protein